MSTWRTMTVGGIYGKSYEAGDAETAVMLAEADRYDVLDVMDDILVIADGA